MIRKLRLDGLRAEQSAVQDLLQEAHDVEDPVGELQYEHRKEMLETEISELEKTVLTHASIALFFGGGPVLGSKGIAAEFAGNILEKFQDLITRTFAKTEVDQLGKRGPIPQQDNAKLMVTELARGSFGFVLDEMSDQTDFQGTSLKLMVDEVAKIIEGTGSTNDPDFEEMLESLDERTLIALRDFFNILDKNKATIRIVDDGRDFILDQYAVHRGCLRIRETFIEENEINTSGRIIGVLPEHKKFEFTNTDMGSIYGSVSKEAAKQYLSMIHSNPDVLIHDHEVKITVRTVKPLNRPERKVYRLVEFINDSKT